MTSWLTIIAATPVQIVITGPMTPFQANIFYGPLFLNRYIRMEFVVLNDAMDWPANLEKSQDCEAGRSRGEVLERMSAHN